MLLLLVNATQAQLLAPFATKLPLWATSTRPQKTKTLNYASSDVVCLGCSKF